MDFPRGSNWLDCLLAAFMRRPKDQGNSSATGEMIWKVQLLQGDDRREFFVLIQQATSDQTHSSEQASNLHNQSTTRYNGEGYYKGITMQRLHLAMLVGKDLHW